jgi:putative peptidoglycan lipid II flippase
LVAAGPALVAVSTACYVLAAGGTWGAYALVAGILTGHALELGVLGVALKRLGLPAMPRWHGQSEALTRVLLQGCSITGAAVLMTGTLAIDQAMAAMLEAGDVSALNYGYKVVALVLALSAGLWTAFLPYFSKAVSQRAWVELSHALQRYSRLIFAAGVPLVVAIVVSAKLIVRLLFEHGAFTPEDTGVVASVLALYALQIPFYVFSMLVMRLISSFSMNRFLLWTAALGLVLNVLGNVVFMHWLGVAGIALSTSIAYVLVAGYLWYVQGRLMRMAIQGAG